MRGVIAAWIAVVGLGCPATAPMVLDADGDGWLDEEDCGPGDAAVHPRAADPWGDGVDADCDGVDGVDADGDGFLAEAEGLPIDCDDTDPGVNPGNLWDPPFDELDSNCDGTASMYATPMDVVVTTDQALTDFGWSVAAADLDGDGRAEVFVGAPRHEGFRGRVYGFRGEDLVDGSATTVEDAWWILEGESGGDAASAGVSVSLDGDVDGDGRPDLLVLAGQRSQGHDAVYVVPGVDLLARSEHELAGAPIQIQGDDEERWIESIAVWVRDLDGDGRTDIALGNVGEESGVHVFLATTLLGGDVLSKADADARVYDPEDPNSLGSSMWGRSIAGVPDIDGDGTDELMMGDPRDFEVHGLPGGFEPGLVLTNDETPFGITQWNWGTEGRLGATLLAANDLDGGGTPDLFVGAPWVPGTGFPVSDSGGYLLLASLEGAIGAGWQEEQLMGPMVRGWEGAENVGRGALQRVDLDADGVSEVLFESWDWPNSGISAIHAEDYLSGSGSRSGQRLGPLGIMRSGVDGLHSTAWMDIADVNGDGISDIVSSINEGLGEAEGSLGILYGRPTTQPADP